MKLRINFEPGVYVERFCAFCKKSVGCNPYWWVGINGNDPRIQCHMCRGKIRKAKKRKK